MLVRRRHSRWARRKGRHAIRTLLRGLRDDGTWDTGQFEYASLDVPNLGLPRDDQHPTSTNGRMLEALIWFYESTGEAEAMELADRVARIHLKRTVQESGLVRDDDVPGHTHSYLNTLRGLILYGELTNQRQVIDIIRQTYHGTVKPKVLRPSGFANHDFGKDTKPDTASCGDAVQIALWLNRLGNDALLDDVERLVRCRLIPCQVVKEEDLYPVPEADDSDNYRDLSRRFIGALGGIHNEPHGGKRGTTDVSAAVLHTLIDVYENIVVRRPAGLTVQFHFDYEDGEISIRSTRNGRAKVTAVLRHPQNLLIRVPGWASPDSVTFDVAGESVTPLRLGTFAFFAGEQMTGPITLTYDLPRSTTEEDIDGTHFTTQWRGDEILGISPNTDCLPFYPTGHGRQNGKSSFAFLEAPVRAACRIVTKWNSTSSERRGEYLFDLRAYLHIPAMLKADGSGRLFAAAGKLMGHVLACRETAAAISGFSTRCLTCSSVTSARRSTCAASSKERSL